MPNNDLENLINILKNFDWFEEAYSFTKDKDLSALVKAVPSVISVYCNVNDSYECQVVNLRALKLAEFSFKRKNGIEFSSAKKEEKTISIKKSDLKKALLKINISSNDMENILNEIFSN